MVALYTSVLDLRRAIGTDDHTVRTDTIAYRRHSIDHGSALSAACESARFDDHFT
jgi:hypothetical protein